MTKKRKLTTQNAGKLAFSQFVETLKLENIDDSCETKWMCCDTTFTCLKDVHKHASLKHRTHIEELKETLLQQITETNDWEHKKRCIRTDSTESLLPNRFCGDEDFKWLPKVDATTGEEVRGQILLFYHYRWIDNTKHVVSWQKELCRRLNITGKIRVAKEGLNATVGGTRHATGVYKEAVLNHPLFDKMTAEDFKVSEGSADDFPDGLKVGTYNEVCPMGVEPQEIPFTNAGKHVNPEEFHAAVEKHLHVKSEDETVFVDCRNFYESKIGAFKGAVLPDIRKFSYWPEYVDKNTELFKDKTVYMYCTGGIRCERGSAYLKSKGICKDVLQLSGGIHKYMEQYPEGYFRGKLFVFDNRFHIKSNDDVVSNCTYCDSPWDSYEPCSSAHCHQLVLSCTECRSKSLTACCRLCQKHADEKQHKEQCECTEKRVRVPVERTASSAHKDSNPVEIHHKT